MNYKFIAVISVISIISAACTPSASLVQTAIAQTQAVMPSQTSITNTPSVSQHVDIENIILLPGDLPKEFVRGQTKNFIPKDFFRVPEGASKVINQEFEAEKLDISYVVILQYESLVDVNKVYDTVFTYLDKTKDYNKLDNILTIRGLGETSHIAGHDRDANDSKRSTVHVVFTRCNAFVYIYFKSDKVQTDSVAVYAQRLDSRLKPLICI